MVYGVLDMYTKPYNLYIILSFSYICILYSVMVISLIYLCIETRASRVAHNKTLSSSAENFTFVVFSSAASVNVISWIREEYRTFVMPRLLPEVKSIGV